MSKHQLELQPTGRSVGENRRVLLGRQRPSSDNRWPWPHRRLSDLEVRRRQIEAGFLPRYLDADWSRVPGAELIQGFLIEEYYRQTTRPPRGLFILGEIGVGKTSLLALIARYFFLSWSVKLRFISTGSLFDLIFERNRDGLQEIMSVPVLLLDDVGREYSSEYPCTMFENIIDYRYSKMLPTFASSNLRLDTLRNKSGFERISDRLNDGRWVRELTLAGSSQRIR